MDGSAEPVPGMIIFFDWDSPDGSSGPQDGLSDHTGIVQKVENGIVYMFRSIRIGREVRIPKSDFDAWLDNESKEVNQYGINSKKKK